MMRWTLLAVAVFFAGLGLLTVFRIPDWVNWKFTVVACSFGYLVAVIPLIAALLAWFLPGNRGGPSIWTAIVGVLGFLLLEQPCAQAWLIARDLPAKLAERFGPASPKEAPFTFSGLFRLWPEAAPMTTWTYSDSLKLDFYPAMRRVKAPCVIVIHGGGWDSGDRGQIPQFTFWLARRGYAVADISYRLAPDAIWPAQRDDVAAAVAFVKAHAGKWDIDASRLVLLGRSAGGQIAEACGYALHDRAIRGVVALYAPSDMRFAWTLGRPDDALNSPRLLRRFLGGTPETAGPAYDSSSALSLVTPESPPTLMVHGTIDTLVWHRHSIRLAARLAESGVPSFLVSLPWASHALDYNLSSPSGQLTTYSVEWFLEASCR
jgi:acetyl esterase/lipase